MKRIIAILLCFGLLFVLSSCFRRIPDHSDTDTTDINELNGDTNIESDSKNNQDSLSTDRIYGNILNIYRNLLLLKKNNTNYDKLVSEQYPERDEITKAVFRAVLGDSPENMGYAMKDLNENGNDELILLGKDYHIYAIFTVVNGHPIVVDDVFFGDGNHTGAIGTDGTLYKHGYGKGENVYWYMNKISNDGTLIGTQFGCLDSDIDDIDVEYYKLINGERTVIDEPEYQTLINEFYQIVGNYTDLTKSSGIEFISMEIE